MIVIEHNTDVMKLADYIIDIGPDGDKLVGTLCMRTPQHIGGFFVDAAYHRRGIGRQLFDSMS